MPQPLREIEVPAALPLSTHCWSCNGEYFPALICSDGNRGSFRGFIVRFALILGSRLPKTRSMDDLLSACDSSSPLTRTSSDPNLNNHCQEVRVGLEARHASTEGAEGAAVATGEARPREEKENPPLQDRSCAEHEGPSRQLGNQAAVPDSRVPVEVEKGNGALMEELDGIGRDANSSGQENSDKVSTSSGKHLEICPQEPWKSAGVVSNRGGCPKRITTCQDIPSQESLAPGTPSQDITGPALGMPCPDADKGRGDAGQSMPSEEPGQPGRLLLEQWRKPISQSQSSEFSFLGSNWDSFQGMVTSLPNGEPTPRHLLSYGCCNKRPSSKPLWAPGLCLSGPWSGREGGKPSACAGHVNTYFGKSSRLWLPCHLKQASGPKHLPPKCPSPVPPLYLDDDGLPFPTDVIQHRLRQIEASYKQEVEQLRRQVRELQLRLDIRHFCTPPAEPPMDYEDDFVSTGRSHPMLGPCTPAHLPLQLTGLHPFGRGWEGLFLGLSCPHQPRDLSAARGPSFYKLMDALPYVWGLGSHPGAPHQYRVCGAHSLSVCPSSRGNCDLVLFCRHV